MLSEMPNPNNLETPDSTPQYFGELSVINLDIYMVRDYLFKTPRIYRSDVKCCDFGNLL